ncbi:MAG: hypothetical protein L0229_27085 [Blastocatellia bacterium]|nr:hypothetical protein [Blastocatellia bacterium]
MKITRYFLLTALFLAAGLVGGAVSRGLLSTPSAEASRTNDDISNDGQLWEYCAVSKAAYVSTNRAGGYWITYFTESGFKVEDVEDKATRNAALSLAFSKLGQDGWEMVGTGPLEVREKKIDAYYFKRPKR